MRSEMREYRNHTILVRVTSGSEHAQELLVDGRAVDYGMLTDGRYVLDEYAGEPRETLLELAERYIDRRYPQGGASGRVAPADEDE